MQERFSFFFSLRRRDRWSSELSAVLVEADHVAARVAKSGSDFRRVSSNGLHNLATMGDDCLQSRLYTIDHHVNEKAGNGRRRSSLNPGTAYFADAIIEGSRAVTALLNIPAKDALVEFGRAGYVGGGDFDVTDLSVAKGGRHGEFFPDFIFVPCRSSLGFL
jgi:hypothetical protein